MNKDIIYNESLMAGAAVRDGSGKNIARHFNAIENGYLPNTSVGYAKNLIMPNTPTEQEFNSRIAGDGVIETGVAVYDKIMGRSLVWNQLAKSVINDTNYSRYFVEVTNNEGFNTLTRIGGSSSYPGVSIKGTFVVGHKYLASADARTNATCETVIYVRNTNVKRLASSSAWKNINLIFTFAEGDQVRFGFTSQNAGESMDITEQIVIDLTTMFGAGNEPTTYEEYLKRKPQGADEFAFNAGKIINNNVSAVKTIGKNLWDEQWRKGHYSTTDGTFTPTSTHIGCTNYIDVENISTLYIAQTADVCMYDHNKTFVKGMSVIYSFAIPSGVKYIRFSMKSAYGASYKNDICINISDPSFNGQYAPYEERTLDLSFIKDLKDEEGNVVFPEGLKQAGSVSDEAGEDKAVKRIHKVTITADMLDSSLSVHGSYKAVVIPSSVPANMVYDKEKFPPLGPGIWGGVADAKSTYPFDSIRIGDRSLGARKNNLLMYMQEARGVVIVGDENSTLETFRAMCPFDLQYALPTSHQEEYTYDPKNLTIPVTANGMEEAISEDESTPVRAMVSYGIDAVQKILDLEKRVAALEGK